MKFKDLVEAQEFTKEEIKEVVSSLMKKFPKPDYEVKKLVSGLSHSAAMPPKKKSKKEELAQQMKEARALLNK